MGIEGLWSLQVQTPAGAGFRPGGVVVFETGRVFGGDSGFIWTGTFEVNRNHQIEARVRVKQYNFTGGMTSVFGVGMTDYELDLLSDPLNGKNVRAIGRLTQNPSIGIVIDFTKQAELP